MTFSNFNITKGVFEVSFYGPDGNPYDLELPSIEEEEIVMGSDGVRHCAVNYYVNHDWIECGFGTAGGDHDYIFDEWFDDRGRSIEDQILDMWYDASHSYEDFYEYVINEVLLLEECA